MIIILAVLDPSPILGLNVISLTCHCLIFLHCSTKLSAADESLGHVISALKKSGLWDDTLVIFTSDNGGTPSGSNKPHRGYKSEVWEGEQQIEEILKHICTRQYKFSLLLCMIRWGGFRWNNLGTG